MIPSKVLTKTETNTQHRSNRCFFFFCLHLSFVLSVCSSPGHHNQRGWECDSLFLSITHSNNQAQLSKSRQGVGGKSTQGKNDLLVEWIRPAKSVVKAALSWIFQILSWSFITMRYMRLQCLIPAYSHADLPYLLTSDLGIRHKNVYKSMYYGETFTTRCHHLLFLTHSFILLTQVLIASHLPSYELRHNQVESIFLSAIDMYGHQFCIENLQVGNKGVANMASKGSVQDNQFSLFPH